MHRRSLSLNFNYKNDKGAIRAVKSVESPDGCLESRMDSFEEEGSSHKLSDLEFRKKLLPLKLMSFYSGGMSSSIGSASSLNTVDGDYEMEPGDTNHNINVVVRLVVCLYIIKKCNYMCFTCTDTLKEVLVII